MPEQPNLHGALTVNKNNHVFPMKDHHAVYGYIKPLIVTDLNRVATNLICNYYGDFQ